MYKINKIENSIIKLEKSMKEIIYKISLELK